MVKRTKQEWEQLIKECRESGKSTRTWCKNNGIAYSTFQSRLRQISQENQEPKAASSSEDDNGSASVVWAELETPQQQKAEIVRNANPKSRISLSRCGWNIELETGFDIDLLAEVMSVVDRVCC